MFRNFWSLKFFKFHYFCFPAEWRTSVGAPWSPPWTRGSASTSRCTVGGYPARRARTGGVRSRTRCAGTESSINREDLAPNAKRRVGQRFTAATQRFHRSCQCRAGWPRSWMLLRAPFLERATVLSTRFLSAYILMVATRSPGIRMAASF